MAIDRTFEAIPIKIIEASALTSSYQTIGSALSSPAYILTLFNSSDSVIYISENGVDDHYRLSGGSSRSLDIQANKVDKVLGSKKVGLQFYARCLPGVVPTNGYVWIEGQTS